MKKTFIILIIGLTPTTPVQADEFDDLFKQDINTVVDASQFSLVKTVSNQDVADVLIDLGAVSILQENIYLLTNPFNQRDLLDDPAFLTQREYYNHPWIMSCQLFWNQTGRMYFTDDSSNISSYLAIGESDLLDKLNSSDIKNIFDDFDVDPVSIFPLFANGTVQQRRFGLMIEAERKTDTTCFRFFTPFYYLERNFYLTEEEQEAIEAQLGKGNNEDTELFARNHLICDRLGFGDSRFTVDYPVVQKAHILMQLGFQGTLPTSFAVADGLLGRDFQKCTDRPQFSFNQLFELGQGSSANKAQAEAIVQKFTLDALDTLATNLLSTGLGNGRHLGLGAYLQTKTELHGIIHRPWAEKFFFRNRLSFDYYLPAYGLRNFVEVNNLQGFEQNGLLRPTAEIKAQVAADPAYAQQVVAFLEGQFVDRLFPFVYCTKVCPGGIFHSTSRFTYEATRGGFHIGTDLWVQLKEKLRDINFVQVSPNRPPNIDIAAATRPFAYQSRLVGALYYKVLRPHREWTLGLNSSGTFSSSGIGKEFTLSLNLEVNF